MTPESPTKAIKHILHEGKYAAEVDVTWHYNNTAWDPTLTIADVEKLERIRFALRQGDVNAAAKEAKVFELVPLAAGN